MATPRSIPTSPLRKSQQRTAMDKVAVSRAVAGLLRARAASSVYMRRRTGDMRCRSLSGARRRLGCWVVPVALAYETALARSIPLTAPAWIASCIALLSRATEIGPAEPG